MEGEGAPLLMEGRGYHCLWRGVPYLSSVDNSIRMEKTIHAQYMRKRMLLRLSSIAIFDNGGLRKKHKIEIYRGKKLNSSKNREAGKLAVNLLSPQAWYYFTIFKANQAIKNMLIGTSDFPVGLQTFMWL